jgi:hypothetical protein
MKMARILSVLMLTVLLSAGCQPGMEKLTPCEGKASVSSAVDGLNARAAKMLPLKASGRCTTEYYDQDGKKRHESFPVIIRTMPPQGLYFQGNLIIPKGVVLGTNAEEFWLWIKLKEVDTFWSGPMGGCAGSESTDGPAMLVPPASVLESLSYVKLDPQNPGGQSFQYRSPYDVVTVHAADGRIARKMWIYSCDSTPRKIEYYGADGKPVVTTTMGHYVNVAGEFAVPTQIEMTLHRGEGRTDKLSIMLNKDVMEVFEPTKRQAEVLFSKPDPAGTKHILKLGEGCRFEEVAPSR